MQTAYQKFFTEQGFHLDTQQPAAYIHPETDTINNTNTYLTLLSQTGLIQVSGADHQTFLQNLTSNDIRHVSEHQYQLSGFCSPKGRLLAVFRIFQHQDSYYLTLPTNIVEVVLKRLQMFVLRSKVQLQNVSIHKYGLGLSGTNSVELIAAMTGRYLEAEDTTSITTETLSILRTAGKEPRFEIFGDAENIINCWKTLQTATKIVGEQHWLLENIRVGLPVIYLQTQETFVPQMINLDLINGISFKKGCYPGQEVVARTHYLGKIKRRMHRIQFLSKSIPQPGMDLFDGQSDNTQTVGTLVEVQASNPGQYEALAVIQEDYLKSDLRFQSKQGTQVTLLDLPYMSEEYVPATSD